MKLWASRSYSIYSLPNKVRLYYRRRDSGLDCRGGKLPLFIHQPKHRQRGLFSMETMKDENVALQPRSYQMEMVEESLKQNIIVAMDTGSGKTHIAIKRIQLEIERCAPEQIVWFLAPTVALCEQQYATIARYIRQCQTVLLTGKDEVERWSSQALWDKVLHNVKIVVSTHAILNDALTHGFVSMVKLALLVFDEGKK